MPKKQKQRTKKAMKNTVKVLASRPVAEEEEQEMKPGCCERFSCCRSRKEEKLIEEEEEEEKVVPSTEISPEMQKASNEGLNMVKNIIFPSLPAVLQDLWVYLELAISIIAFAFGLLDIFPIEDGLAFNYSYFGLATISMILALIDGYIYFFQLGSCARGIRVCRQKLRERKGDDNEEEDEGKDDDDTEDEQNKRCGFSKKWKERFNTWFEFGRNLLTELLLYPLLIFDMFDFVTSTGYQPEGDLGRTDFSLFVIGGFYLILSVYIMRIFMVAGSMLSLIRIPTNPTKKEAGNGGETTLLIKFCAHVLGQIIVHLMIILVIGTKINNENRNLESMVTSMNMTMNGNDTLMMNMTGGGEDSGMNASPFLITAIVLGWVIPVAGISAFFVVNYYWMKEFSIGFWVNMISLLQGESFAETVFGGEGDAPKQKALEFVEKSQYKKVKKQLEQFKAPSVWTKFFFPARVPVTAISGLLYDIALLAFIACLMLTYEDGSVRLVIFTDDIIMTVGFMISVTIIILANIHILILLNLILFMVVLIFAVAAAIAAFLSPLLLFMYFPSVACLGYFMLFYEAGSSLRKKGGRSDLTKSSAYKLNDEYHNGGGIVLENTAIDIDTKSGSFDTDYKLHSFA